MEEKTVHTEEKKTTKERKKETNKNGQNFAPLVQKKKGGEKEQTNGRTFPLFLHFNKHTHTQREQFREKR